MVGLATVMAMLALTAPVSAQEVQDDPVVEDPSPPSEEPAGEPAETPEPEPAPEEEPPPPEPAAQEPTPAEEPPPAAEAPTAEPAAQEAPAGPDAPGEEPAQDPPPEPAPAQGPTPEPVVEPEPTPIEAPAAADAAADAAAGEPAAIQEAAVVALAAAPGTVFINELHYDNAGSDVGEFVEVAAPAGTDLTGYSVVLYNGNGGTTYGSPLTLSGIVADQLDGYGTVFVSLPSNGLQNGAPDGLALVDDLGAVLEFLSYEGTMAAADGPAIGMTSVDIGVFEASAPIGESLQLIGSGQTAAAFTWTGPVAESPGLPNAGQDFSGVGPTPTPTPTPPPVANVFISEFHYDNDGGDVGEFVEVTGPAGTDLTGWSIVLYNGSNGTAYNTTPLTGAIDDEDGTSGAISVDIAGIQNGSPDGIVLIAPDASVVGFLSYEGVLTATDGPALGLTSTDVLVSEPGNTPIGQSLQLIGGVWVGPETATAGVLNAPPAPPVPYLSEIHYDNSGADIGEFIEVTGLGGLDLAGYTVVTYNGNSGAAYGTPIALTGVIAAEAGSSLGAVAVDAPGLQNGSPDGFALIDPDGIVLEFLSYEGSFVATDGPALGLTSLDIDVAELGTTPAGQSLQLLDFIWIGPAVASPNAVNTPPVVGATPRFIHEIQGPGDASPLVGQEVLITGIVVGDFQEIVTADATDAPLDGFFVQEEDADADADPSTSEGIFVYVPGGASVALGDLVEVTGIVTEFFTLTELGNVSLITVLSSGNPLPTPASPVVPTAVGDVPVDWEAIEGMSVSFTQPLFVTGTFPQGRYGEVQLSAVGPQDHPNQNEAVGSAESAAQRQLNLDSRVILDDGEDENESFPNGIPTWNPNPTPYLGGPDNTLRSGDVVNSLSGVVHFSFGEWEVQPVNPADATDPDGGVSITRTPRPATVPDVGGSLQVASFNVLNYFTTIDTGGAQCGVPASPQGCRGADTQAEFDIQSAKIAAAIAGLDADIVGLIELENNATDTAIADLVAKVNALTARTYDYVPTGFIGTDAIAVGFIYDTSTVALDGGFAVLDSSVSPAFIDDKNRPVLAQTFIELETEATLTAAVAHLKSKGSSCDDVANPGDPAYGVAGYGAGVDIEDPNFQGNCNLTRQAAAEVLGQWIAQDPTGAPSDNLLIIGDLNAYAQEDPIAALELQGYTDLHAIGGTSWAVGGHSYVFDGEHGTLDYLMANPALLTQVTGATAWHINADEPFAIDYQDFNPAGQAQPDAFKSSDHDPTIVGLDLTPPIPPGPTCNGIEATIVGTEGVDVLIGTNGADVIVALGGNDFVFSFGGDDIICLGEGNDFASTDTGNDTVFGEGGRDVILGGDDNDTIDGGDDRDYISGEGGDDTISGGNDNDVLFGASGIDFIDGGAGNDYGNGGSGADTCVDVEFAISCQPVAEPQ